MSPERARQLLVALRRLDAAMDLPPVRELTGHVEELWALLHEAAPHLPAELKYRVERTAPRI